MSFRFCRRIRIAPGITLNLSKSGGSLSFGPRGAKFTLGTSGQRATLGIPGTGLFYTKTLNGAKGRSAGQRTTPEPVKAEDRLTLGFFRRLVTPDDEEALVDGCRELVLGHEDRALEHLERATHLADGAYLAGFLFLKHGQFQRAADCLEKAAENHHRLGRYFDRYGISATMSLPVTDEVTTHIGASLRGVLLGLTEAWQRLDRPAEALACLERLRKLEPDDVVIRLSLAELLLDDPEDPRKAAQRVVRLAKGIENESGVHAALLYYKARALRILGLPEAARETLTLALRRRKGRSEELLRVLRYERIQVYEELGQHRRARSELEKLYAEAPDYEDVAARLGL